MKSYEPQSEPITAYAVEDPVTIVPVAVPVTVSEEFVVPTAPPLHSTIQNSIEQALMPDAPLSFETKQIPVYFEQCPSLCCAYNLYYCTSYSECVGFKGNCVLCCFESEDFCLKYVEDNQKTNCICASRDVECVNCADFCKCYRQCFCCEILCSCPYDGTYRTTNVIYRSIPDRTEIPANNNNIICQALFCSITSIFCTFPESFSGYEKTICLCIESENLCSLAQCFDSTKQRKNSICILQRGQCFLVSPKTCCKGISQLFCFENRRALPCDADVPCAFTPIPFCTCCVKWRCFPSCCPTLGMVRNYTV